MRIEYREDGTADVYVRQSWLNDARDCLEKGRRGIIHPLMAVPTDAACIGTAVHAGAEAYCNDDLLTVNEVTEASLARWDQLVQEPLRFVTYTATSARAEVAALSRSWYMGLRQYATASDVVAVEHQFVHHVDTIKMSTTPWHSDMDVRIWLTGTIDLVRGDGLWDWKTSKKKYVWRDKQSDAIQPTVYAAAAVAEGWLEWPVRFTYGVMLRGSSDTQVVHVNRTEDHYAWLRRSIRPLVRQAIQLGLEDEWPHKDNHALCTDTWCPYWAMCKGAHLAPVSFHQPRKAQP